MAEIKLTQGKVTIVDEADYKWLNQWKWYAQHANSGQYYAMRKIDRIDLCRIICMHRLILNASEGLEVDHISGDALDNRRENLRLCTKAQNAANQKKRKSVSRYKGVTPHQGKWRACISPNGKTVNLGSFDIEQDAAEAYDKAAEFYYKEFALTNRMLEQRSNI